MSTFDLMNASHWKSPTVPQTKPLSSISHDQALTAQRNHNVEQLGLMAGGIVHDFNNTLTSIMGHMSLALLKMPADAPARNHVEKAIKAAKFAALLTTQLLSYARAEEGRPETVDLNRLVQDTVNLLADVLLKDVHIHLRLSPALPIIDVVVAEIQQVIMNLVVNATEAMEWAGGELAITTGREALCCGTELNSMVGGPLPTGDYVYFSVKDTGKGMEESALAHIFDPFYSTKSSGGGFGLPTSLDIVKRHGGGILVDSQKNQGATFTVFLPVQPHIRNYLGVH